MNRYEKEALADIQAQTSARLEGLGLALSKLMDEGLPVGKRPRLSRRIRTSLGMYRAVEAATRLLGALIVLKAIPLDESTESVILDNEDKAVGALLELVEAMK